jgi:creatinine amidohydrolase
MQLAEMTWPKVRALVPDTPIVIPVAALEQHGLHMPLATDAILLGEVVRRVDEALGERVIFAPVQWLGNSHHHMEYAGTLSAGPRTYLDLLGDLLENVLRHGFCRVLILNGHGGNVTPLKQAIFETRQRLRDRRDLLLLGASYWDFGGASGFGPEFVQNSVGHACEWETSMMLAIRPDLVGSFESLERMDTGYSFEPAYRGWITQERRPSGSEAPGHLGDPRFASREKGETLMTSFSAGVVTFLEKVIRWDGQSWEFQA